MKKFLNYIHNFRGIAIIFIIFGHAIEIVKPYADPKTYNILSAFFENGTVLFVFIAGFLFQHLSYKYTIKNYYKSKLLNVILPYTLVSIPGIIYKIGFNQWDIDSKLYNGIVDIFGSKLILLAKIIFLYLTGYYQLGPLWFIPMISIVYLISPILVKLDKWNKFYYFLPIILIITIIVPRNPGYNIINNLLHFLPIYISGMCFSRYKNIFINFIQKNNIILSILFIFLLILSYLDTSTNYMFNPLGKNAFLMTWSKLLLCLLLINWLSRNELVVKKKFFKLADLSFGLYFIHQYIIMCINYIVIRVFPNNSYLINLLSIPIALLFGLLVTFIGFIILRLAKLIFKDKSKYLLGY